MHPTALEALSDVDLARLMLRQLWQDQDASGISVGRHPRNCLLEAAMGLIPMPRNIDSESFDELNIEAERRMKLGVTQLTLGGSEVKIEPIQELNSLALATLLLGQLKLYYDEHLAREPVQRFGRESQIFAAALKLLPKLPEVERQAYTSEELLEEVSRRNYVAALALFEVVD